MEKSCKKAIKAYVKRKTQANVPDGKPLKMDLTSQPCRHISRLISQKDFSSFIPLRSQA
jgi:hypothetical protein